MSTRFGQNQSDSVGRIPNRITGDPLFADATSGDYHLQSTAGRWNGSAWVTDAVTSLYRRW